MSRDIDKYADEYINNEHYDFEKYQIKYRRKNILDQLKMNNDSNILEIGCGIDPLFQYINCYNTYTIIVPSKKFVQIANGIKNNDKINIINDYIENTKINTKFDFIIISSLLHEIEDPSIILNAAKQYMNKDSILYINVPNAKSFHRLLAYKSSLIDSIYSKSNNQKKFQQSHTFDMNSLEKLTEEQGYITINSGSYFIKPFTHVQMRELLDNNIISEEILDGFNDMIEYCPDIGSEIFITCQYNKKGEVK